MWQYWVGGSTNAVKNLLYFFFCFCFFSDKAKNENKAINKIKTHKTKQNSGGSVCVLECEWVKDLILNKPDHFLERQKFGKQGEGLELTGDCGSPRSPGSSLLGVWWADTKMMWCQRDIFLMLIENLTSLLSVCRSLVKFSDETALPTASMSGITRQRI